MRASLKGGAEFYNVIEDEMQKVQKAIRNAISDEFVSANATGIRNAVAAGATTYGGVSRAAVPEWASLVQAVGAPLSRALLEAQWLAATDPERKISPTAQAAAAVIAALGLWWLSASRPFDSSTGGTQEGETATTTAGGGSGVSTSVTR